MRHILSLGFVGMMFLTAPVKASDQPPPAPPAPPAFTPTHVVLGHAVKYSGNCQDGFRPVAYVDETTPVLLKAQLCANKAYDIVQDQQGHLATIAAVDVLGLLPQPKDDILLAGTLIFHGNCTDGMNPVQQMREDIAVHVEQSLCNGQFAIVSDLFGRYRIVDINGLNSGRPPAP